MLLVIISNNAIATVKGNTLICDKDRRGYSFITENKVEVLSVNFNKLNIISIDHSYQLSENTIFIKKPLKEFNKDLKSIPIGWIFRRTLDYVSLNYINGDWSRKFLWSCEVTSLDKMKKRLKNKIDKLIKFSGNKIKESN